MSQVRRSAASGSADIWGGPAEGLFEQAEGVLDVEASQVSLPETIGVCRGASVPDHHGQTGFGVAPLGRWSMSRRSTVPSTTGRVPSVVAQEERWVSLGCSRSQERALAVP